MIPTRGWEAEAVEDDPISLPLPVPHEWEYSDSGAIGRAKQHVPRLFQDATSEMSATLSFFRVTLRLHSVHDVALLDRVE